MTKPVNGSTTRRPPTFDASVVEEASQQMRSPFFANDVKHGANANVDFPETIAT